MKQNIIVHRGNSPLNKKTPVEQVEQYIAAGYSKIEIDIYAISESTYKFCHPLDGSVVDEIYDIKDGFVESLVKNYPSIEWLVDLKCLDLNSTPILMMQYLSDTIGDSAIFIAAQKEILEFMSKKGRRIGQYFNSNTRPSFSREPDLYIQNASESMVYPHHRTIVHCQDVADSLDYLSRGFAGGMVDGYLLIEKTS